MSDTQRPAGGGAARIARLFADYHEAVRAFSPNSRLFLVGQALLWIGTNQIALLLSLYLKGQGYTEDAIGNVLATRALGSAIVALPASFVAARLRLSRLLPISAFFTAAAYIAQSLSESVSVVVGAAFLSGAFSTAFQVSSGPFFMRNSSPKERVHLFSLNGALSMGTGIIGSILGGFLKDLVHSASGDEILAYRVGLAVGAAFVLASWLPFARIRDAAQTATLGEKRPEARGPEHIGPVLWTKLLVPHFLVALGAGLTIPYLNLYFKDVFGMGDGAIGLAVAAGQVATFTGMAAGPAIARRLGKARSVFVTQALSVPLILVLAWLRLLPLAIVAYLARQSLMNMATPIQDIFVLELVPPSRMILVNAVKMLVWSGAWTISARLSGWIIWNAGFGPSFTLTASLYASASVLFWFFFLSPRRKPLAAGLTPPDSRDIRAREV